MTDRCSINLFIFCAAENIDNQDDEKRSGCVLTETGKCHLLFDVASLLENCALSITGAFYIGKHEKNFDPLVFCGIVIGSHIVGLLLKFFYYQFQHPWMTLSDARDCMSKVSKVILSLLAVGIVVGILYIAISLYPSTTSTLLYILIGFSVFTVTISDYSKYFKTVVIFYIGLINQCFKHA